MNKKIISLVSTLVLTLTMFLGVIQATTVNLNAYTSGSYITSADVKTTVENSVIYFNITLTVIGTSDIANNQNALLESCTLIPKDTTSIIGYLSDEIVIGASNITESGSYFTVKFKNLRDINSGNNISFSLLHINPDGSRAKEILTYDLTNRLGRPGSGGTGSTSSSDTSSKQIAALKPHLIVDSYSYGEAIAGQDVPLTFTLKNTSKNKIMRNIVLAVKPSAELRIKSASDTIYIDSIDPGKTVTKSLNFSLSAASKEDVQSVSLTSTFEYFDLDGENAVAGGDTVSISVAADTVERVKIQKAQLPDMLYPNTEEEVTYSIINSGFTTLYNAEIKIVDDAGTEYANVYVGSIQPSKAVTEPNLYLTFPEAGEKNLKFILSYENDKLQVQETSKDLKATIMEMVNEKPPIIDMPMPGESLPGEGGDQNPMLMWIIIGGAVLAAIIAAVIIVKVVKRKRREREDEDI